MMDHPNIARVLDAGTTDSGLPFFAMELVKGIPITQYCDEHRLGRSQQRLQLFVDVCHAVQHAHQKGIIHRDLKPSNVLIAEYDDQAVPKIIDFGVAKAVQQRLTEKTMFTQIGQVVGTPEYMSPEQAKLNQLDIDTRSDIYSLGVLLYELLTGETPFDRQRLRSAAFDEMLRILRDEEPPRPSLRLSSSQSLPSIAANRHVEPRKLSMLIRGELDWIVMKALEKERTRRYETANGFAADVDHYLSDEPVQACPPSAAYRFRKLARRNKGPLTAATVLLAGVGHRGGRSGDRGSPLSEAGQRKCNARGEESGKAGGGSDRRRRRPSGPARGRGGAESGTESPPGSRASKRTGGGAFRLGPLGGRRILPTRQREPAVDGPWPAIAAVGTDLFRTGVLRRFCPRTSRMPVTCRWSWPAPSRRSPVSEASWANPKKQRLRTTGRSRSTSSCGPLITHAAEIALGLAEAYHQAGRYGDAATLCEELLAVEPPPVEARSLLADTYDAWAMAAQKEVRRRDRAPVPSEGTSTA